MSVILANNLDIPFKSFILGEKLSAKGFCYILTCIHQPHLSPTESFLATVTIATVQFDKCFLVCVDVYLNLQLISITSYKSSKRYQRNKMTLISYVFYLHTPS